MAMAIDMELSCLLLCAVLLRTVAVLMAIAAVLMMV
jgi:hypothetical protein